MAEETLNLKDIPSTPSKTLEKYQRAIAKEMEKRAGSELKAIRNQLKKLAGMTGMQIVEAGEEESKEPLAVYDALYRHPEHEALTWCGRPGERPSWLKKALEEGWTMEDMRVKEEAPAAGTSVFKRYR